MWKAFLTLALASYCLAAPQQQQGGALDDLIDSVFSGPPTAQPQAETTPEKKESGNNLDALIAGYLAGNQQSSTSPTTYVGTQNKPKPKPDDCECVSYYLCRNGTVVEDGYGLIDIRSDFGANSTSPDQKFSGVVHVALLSHTTREAVFGYTLPTSLQLYHNASETEPIELEIEKVIEEPTLDMSARIDNDGAMVGSVCPATFRMKGYGDCTDRSSGPCIDYLDVCCKAPDKVPDVIQPPHVERKGCGQRNPEGVGFRITGDKNNETKFGEFPWMTAIMKDETIGDSKQVLTVYQCGGSLIHKQAVLTAAHCVHGKEPSTLKIRAGEWDTQTRNEIFPHQDRNVEKVIIHERYYPGALYYDFAILILSQPVELAENVDVVCLPDPNVVYDGSRCFASGWGRDTFGKEGHYQVILKKVDLPVVPRDTCEASLRSTRLGKYFKLHESFICAGGESGKDTCKGDGGSPLVCPSKKDPTRYQQAGIVAWGIGCGDNATPGVYANVAYVREWIDNQMAYHNLDNTVYNL